MRRSGVRSTLPMVCLATLGSLAFAAPEQDWARQAQEHYRAGRFVESSEAYARAIEAGAEGEALFYDAACAAALADLVDTAFDRLDTAVTRGWRDVGHLRADPDLEGLHADPRWNAIVTRVEQAQAAYIATLREPELYRELMDMRRLDQAIRRGEWLPELEGLGMMEVDARHTARMKEILVVHGWPTVSLVGEDGARSAWLLVQHADADPAFQRLCLEKMKSVAAGDVSPIDVAYLTDRVLVNEGKKQIYGTQFWNADGELVPRPIEDESRVEALRAALGMISMQEYHRRMTGRDWVPRTLSASPSR